ncbi:MAG: histidine phosphatase family protein [Rhodobacteraceae bacterium]|nr:histidine phosphatase family protein [Paracoccaceae bacterium]
MTQKWWWVRHGPTHATSFIGHTDMPADLSDVKKIKRLHDLLPDDADLISSDLIRASATADAVAGNRNRLAHAASIREMHFGDWEAREFASVAESDPELSRAFWENPGNACPPNGESWNNFSQRIHGAIAEISATSTAENIIAVAHFGTILAAIQLAGNLSPKSVFSFRIENLSVTRLEFARESGAWSIQGVNHVP